MQLEKIFSFKTEGEEVDEEGSSEGDGEGEEGEAAMSDADEM